MRKVKLYIATSLDGKIASKNGSVDWLPDDPAGEDYGYNVFYDSIDATLMGYKTYETALSLGEWHYKDKVSYIFSRDSHKSLIPEAQLVNENPVEFVKKLKQMQGKDIWLIGGGEIIALLHDAGLINEYILAIVPIVLGEGIELFPNIKSQQQLRFIKQQAYTNGIVMLYYEKEKGKETYKVSETL